MSDGGNTCGREKRAGKHDFYEIKNPVVAYVYKRISNHDINFGENNGDENDRNENEDCRTIVRGFLSMSFLQGH